MLNVKCKNFHQLVFCFLIQHMPALVNYVLQMLTFYPYQPTLGVIFSAVFVKRYF